MGIRSTRRPKPRSPFSPPGVTLVAICAGQSNIMGQGSITFTYTFTDTTVYRKSTEVSTAENGVFSTYAFPTNHSSTTNNDSNAPNPTLYFAQSFEGLAIEELVVIQLAQGTTGFTNGSGAWATSGSLRAALINQYIKPALSKLQALGKNIRLLPINWNQSEEDAKNLTDANAYGTQFQGLLAAIRSAVGVADLPCVMCRLNSQISLAGTRPNWKELQAEQDRVVAADKNLYLINPDGFPMAVDNVHYTAAGYQQLAAAYLKLARQIGVRRWPGDNVVEVTAAPTLTLTESTAITISATAGEYATLHSGVYANGSANPGQAAIKAGTGAGFVARNSAGLIYNAAGSNVVSGLTASTNYASFSFLEDLAGNQSGVTSLAISTPVGNALTTAYENAVVAAGGTLSVAARAAINSMLYDSYSNGASGTGKVADFASKFGFLYAPVSQGFAGFNVPVIGPTFTNVGMVTGNYSRITGLTGNGTGYLNTGYTLPAGSQNSCSIGFRLEADGANTQEAIVGARSNTTSSQFLLFTNLSTITSLLNINARVNGLTTDENVFGAIGGAKFLHANRFDGAGFDLWKDGTKANFAQSSGVSPTQPIFVMAFNNQGSPGLVSGSSVVPAAWVASTALTDAETNILRNAIAALQTARASL